MCSAKKGGEGSRVLIGIPENVLLMFLFKIGVVAAVFLLPRCSGAVVKEEFGNCKTHPFPVKE